MTSWIKRALAGALVGIPLLVACNAGVEPPRGGVMVTILNDGTLDLDQLKIHVAKGDAVLMQQEVAVPQTSLPNTFSIVSNGDATATATLTVSAWKNGVPVDRRDKTITQVPSDRVAALAIWLSAKCSRFVEASESDPNGTSTCGPAKTCAPESASCDEDVLVEASSLPTYDPAFVPPPPSSSSGGPDSGTTGPKNDGGADVAAPPQCERDEDCAGPLTKLVPAGCATATCTPDTKQCVYKAIDRDGDGHALMTCAAPGTTAKIEVGDDCDDTSNKIHPGAWDGPADPADDSRTDSCDARDDDCSGKVDDGKTSDEKICECAPNQKRACAERPDGTAIVFPTGETPAGICAKGDQTCGAGGKWGPCEGAVAPGTRNCASNADNDCDGKPDDEVDALCTCKLTTNQPCYPFTGTPGNGPCRNGTQTCVASGGGTTWGACQNAVGPTPGGDSCSEPGNDNDCNGTKNQGCACVTNDTRPCAGTQCGTGTQTCSNGTWGACQNISAVTESCAGSQCGTGTRTCSDGMWGACTGATTTARACTGTQCGSGTQACVNGTWAACNITTRPTQSCPGSQCGTGSQQCTTTGTWGACGGFTGGGSRTCTGNCANGTQSCTSSGTFGACSWPSSSRGCTKADGCGGGSQSCSGGGPWTTCSGGPSLQCPADAPQLGDGQCWRNGSSSTGYQYMRETGGDGTVLATPAWSPPAGAVPVSASMSISYSDGGCDSGGGWGTFIRCNTGYDRWITQCQSGGGSCGGSTWNDLGAVQHCEVGKVHGWTPAFQETCERKVATTFNFRFPVGRVCR